MVEWPSMRDVEQIIEQVRELCPTVEVRQLKVLHPGADDDGLWYFSQPKSAFEVQIESSDGMCPFLVETDETPDKVMANSIRDTVQTLAKLLHLDEANCGPGG